MPFIIALWNYLLSFSAYLILGLLIAGFIHAFLPLDRIKSSLGGGSFGAIFKSALFGIPLPLCSCSVLPMAITLKKNKASNGAVSSFLISTPETGVDSILLTYGLMDFPMTIFRPIAALISAVIAGLLQNIFNNFEYEDKEAKVQSCCSSTSCSSPIKRKSFGSKIADMMKFAFVDLMDDMAVWLFFGVLVGVGIEMLLPLDLLSNISMLEQKAAVLVIGLPLYICASAVTPIAASLILKGLSPGAGLLLLLVGPATNLSNLLVMQKYIGRKGVIINVVSVACVALGMSFFVDWFYSGKTISFANIMQAQHEHAGWIEVSSAVIVAILLVKGVVLNETVKKFFKSGKSCCEG